MNDDDNKKGAKKLQLSIKRMKKLRSDIKAGDGIATSVNSIRPWNVVGVDA